MGLWVQVPQVKRIADITESEFTDAEVEEFIQLAQRELNSKVVTKVIREMVNYIDPYRSNEINGLNTTFFVRNWKGNYFGDFNYDNVIDVTDVRVFQYNPNTQIETELTPASIDIDNCSFTLSTAPNNVTLYVTYCYLPFDPITPDNFLTLCNAYLAGSYAFVGNDAYKVKFGNVSIEPGSYGGKGKQLYDKYNSLLDQLNINANGGSIVGNMIERI